MYIKSLGETTGGKLVTIADYLYVTLSSLWNNDTIEHWKHFFSLLISQEAEGIRNFSEYNKDFRISHIMKNCYGYL